MNLNFLLLGQAQHLCVNPVVFPTQCFFPRQATTFFPSQSGEAFHPIKHGGSSVGEAVTIDEAADVNLCSCACRSPYTVVPLVTCSD